MDCENRIIASKCFHSKADRGTVCLKPLHGITFLGLAAWMNTSHAMGHSCSSWVFSCHCFLAFLYLVFVSSFPRDPAHQQRTEAEQLCGLHCLCQPPMGINRKSHAEQGLLFPGMDRHRPGHTLSFYLTLGAPQLQRGRQLQWSTVGHPALPPALFPFLTVEHLQRLKNLPLGTGALAQR